MRIQYVQILHITTEDSSVVRQEGKGNSSIIECRRCGWVIVGGIRRLFTASTIAPGLFSFLITVRTKSRFAGVSSGSVGGMDADSSLQGGIHGDFRKRRPQTVTTWRVLNSYEWYRNR